MVLTAATAPAAMALAWWDASNPPQYIITFSRLYSADWFLVSLFSSVSFTREDTAADMQWMIVTYQRLVQETQDRSWFFPISILATLSPDMTSVFLAKWSVMSHWPNSVDLVKIYQTLWCLFVRNYWLRLLHISVQHSEFRNVRHLSQPKRCTWKYRQECNGCKMTITVSQDIISHNTPPNSLSRPHYQPVTTAITEGMWFSKWQPICSFNTFNYSGLKEWLKYSCLTLNMLK